MLSQKETNQKGATERNTVSEFLERFSVRSQLRSDMDSQRNTTMWTSEGRQPSERLSSSNRISTSSSGSCSYHRNSSGTSVPGQRPDLWRRFQVSRRTCGVQTMVMTWLWVTVMVSGVMGQVRQQQRFEREPEDQTAVVGETVVLACRVLHKAGVLQWTKDDFGLGSDRNLSGFDRYSMIGSDEEGTFSLQIRPVTLDDDGRFQCQVGPGPDSDSPAIRSRTASLAVHVEPEPPQIVQGAHLLTTEDREVELECHSRGGKPPAEINWLDGEGNLITTDVEVFKELEADGKRTLVKSVLRFTPRHNQHRTRLTCQSQNAAQRAPQSASIQLEVKYAPKVTLTMLDKEFVTEFEPVRFQCTADANPSQVVYKWYINDEVAYGDYTTELTIASVTRKLHNAVVKCEVHNSVGRSDDKKTVNVHFSPIIRGRPQSVEADVGSNVTLKCDVEGNPTPEITWTHQSSRRILSTGPAYTFWMNSDLAGQYRCTARVPGFPEVFADAQVYLKGPPSITSKKVQFGIEGDTVRIECVAKAVPRPEKILWTHDGREVDTSDSRFSVEEELMLEGLRNNLVIRKATDRDFGVYNCTVINAYGQEMAEIVLKKQKSLPLLIILAGVIGGVVVIVACILVVILCHRRSKHSKESNKGDQMSKQSDQSSSHCSDLKVDIRTASSLSNTNENDRDSVWDDGDNVDRNTPRHNNHTDNYQYAPDYNDPGFPPIQDGQYNNGYVPYSNYNRDYNPLAGPLSASKSSLLTRIPMTEMDPRFSATYGNPYLKSSHTSLPPPLSNNLNLNNMNQVNNIYNNPIVPPTRATPSPQYITGGQSRLEPGTLATHV